MSSILFPIITERLSLVPATVKLYLMELHDRPALLQTSMRCPEEWHLINNLK